MEERENETVGSEIKGITVEPKHTKLVSALLGWGSDNAHLAVDPATRQFYEVYDLNVIKKKRETGCQNVCGHKLRRKHFTCLNCRFIKALRGEIPVIDRVTPVIFLMRDRKSWKRFFAKRVATIYEWLIT